MIMDLNDGCERAFLNDVLHIPTGGFSYAVLNQDLSEVVLYRHSRYAADPVWYVLFNGEYIPIHHDN